MESKLDNAITTICYMLFIATNDPANKFVTNIGGITSANYYGLIRDLIHFIVKKCLKQHTAYSFIAMLNHYLPPRYLGTNHLLMIKQKYNQRKFENLAEHIMMMLLTQKNQMIRDLDADDEDADDADDDVPDLVKNTLSRHPEYQFPHIRQIPYMATPYMPSYVSDMIDIDIELKLP